MAIPSYFDHLFTAGLLLLLGGVAVWRAHAHPASPGCTPKGAVIGAAIGFGFALIIYEVVAYVGRDSFYASFSSLPQSLYSWAVATIDASLDFIFIVSTATGAAVGGIYGYVLSLRHAPS
jgi:hypothetical protein